MHNFVAGVILTSSDLLQGRPPDWQDFLGIIVLLIINSTISFVEENNAGQAAASLMARLAPKTKVGSFEELKPVSKRSVIDIRLCWTQFCVMSRVLVSLVRLHHLYHLPLCSQF